MTYSPQSPWVIIPACLLALAAACSDENPSFCEGPQDCGAGQTCSPNSECVSDPRTDGGARIDSETVTQDGRRDGDHMSGDGGSDTLKDVAAPDRGTGCECSTSAQCGSFGLCVDSCSCSCQPGYTREGGQCQWTGLVQASGFDQNGGWTRLGTVEIRTGDPGDQDKGIAIFKGKAVCGLGALNQSVEIPSRSAVGPLVLAVRYRTVVTDTSWNGPAPAISFNNQPYTDLAASTSWRTARVCLNEGAYDRTSALRVSVRMPPDSCSDVNELQIDRVALVPADKDECPVPGVVDGDFERTLDQVDRWSYGLPADTVRQAGKGSAGSAALAIPLRVNGKCTTQSWVETAIRVPAKHAALSYWVNSDQNRASLEVYYNDELVDTTSAWKAKKRTVCLSPAVWGNGGTLRFNFKSTRCYDNDFYRLDDVKVSANEEACSDPDNLSFETSALQRPWRMESSLSGVKTHFSTGTSYSGPRAMRVEMPSNELCGSVTISKRVTVPHPDSDGGPAVTFWHRSWTYIPPGQAKFSVSSDYGPTVAFDVNKEWQQTTLCLSPTYTGRDVDLRVQFDSVKEEDHDRCYRVDNWYLDHFEIGTDRSCL